MENEAKKLFIKYIINLREKILFIFGRTDHDTIYFEGGLGSQILSYIEFLKVPRVVDLSYFRSPPPLSGNGPDIWNWELGTYGISLESFGEYERLKPFNPWTTRRPTTMNSVTAILSERKRVNNGKRSYSLSENLQKHFPVDRENLALLTGKYDLDLDKTTTIHVRRGDYERVASRLVSYLEYEDLLRSIFPFIEKNLLFISDSNLPDEVNNKFIFSFPEKIIKFYTSLEISTKSAHDIMRTSKVLITANSTFSISAGILSEENTIVLSPIEFFGGSNGYIQSRIFNRYGDFFVMRKSF